MTRTRVARRNNNITLNTRELDNIEELNNYVFNHGVDFESLMNIEESINTIENNKDMHICCSYTNEYVGTIGIALTGDVKCAFNKDVFSMKNNDGSRTITFRNANDMCNSILTSIDDIDTNGMYGEAIVTNVNILYVWVKEEEYSGDSSTIERLSSKYKILYI